MRVRILDLDGSVTAQDRLAQFRPPVLAARHWGPNLRLAIRFGRFRAFERMLASCSPVAEPGQPSVALVGSGDFHHVTLAFLRQLPTPFNLLVLDKHPDWMRAVPVLHCGTWLNHAARLPQVQRIFHVGGDLDFDNSWRWLAPWPLIREGKIVVFPAVRKYQSGPWQTIDHQPLRPEPAARVNSGRMRALLWPYRDELARFPLYLSVDKDVLQATDAVVNWDSGHLDLAELLAVMTAFRQAAHLNVIGADIVGDWSPFQANGPLRHALHWTEHPSLRVDPAQARRVNEQANLALLKTLGAVALPGVDRCVRVG